MLMLLEAVIIMQRVTSLVTEGEFCIQPEYKHATVEEVKEHKIVPNSKIPFCFSIVKNVAGKPETPLKAFAMLWRRVQPQCTK